MNYSAAVADADEASRLLVIFILVLTAVVVTLGISIKLWRVRRRGPRVDADTSWLTEEAGARRAEAMLRERDPDFSLAGIEAHVRALHALLRESAAQGSMSPIQPWLSDALHLRLVLERRLFGSSTLLSAATPPLVGVLVLGLERSPSFQSLRVRVTARADDGAMVSQEWVLLRRPGTTTAAQGLREGACPGCGAPLQLAQTLRCAHCGAVVNSGVHDWVLVDVTQGAASLEGRVAPLDPHGLRALDGALSVESLEDRAALTFWRWREAEYTGRPEAFEALASDAVVAQVGAAHRLGAGREQPHVTTFRLRALVLGDAQQALVSAAWAGHGIDGGEVSAQQVVFRFSRPLTARTADAVGLSTARCPACLAFVDVANHRRCRYCDGALDAGWQLEEILPREALPLLLQQARGG